MSFFKKIKEFFTSTRTPAPGTPVKSAEEVKKALLSINRDGAPFTIQPATGGKADFVAEWKIVNAKWYEIFAKAGLRRVFKIFLKFDETKHEVRALDTEYAVSWTAGVPTLSLAAAAFRGQKQEISFGTAVAFTEEFKPGVVYKYRFVTNEIKKPLQEAVVSSGWTYRGVIRL